MTIAEKIQIQFCYSNKYIKRPDINALLDECEKLGKVTQDWDNESTEFDFTDGSLLVVSGSEVKTYKSR